MDKRGVVEDWGNLVVAIVFSIILLWFFGIGVAPDKLSKDKEVQDRDEQLTRERFLIDYLRTPVSQTDLVVKNIPGISDSSRPALDYAIRNDLTIADLFRLVPTNVLFQDVLLRVTFNDEDFSRNLIRTDLSSFRPEWKDLLLSKPKFGCTGKASVAYIPIEDKNPIAIYVTSCPQEVQQESE